MNWWYVYRKSDGRLISETSEDPTSRLTSEFAARRMSARFDPATHRWNPTLRNIEALASKAMTVKFAAAAGDAAPEVTTLSASQSLHYTFSVDGIAGGTKVLIPFDKLGLDNEVVAPADCWIALTFSGGKATGSVRLSSGRYGIGPRSSTRYAIPEKVVTVLA